jgi:hypothetical protein
MGLGSSNKRCDFCDNCLGMTFSSRYDDATSSPRKASSLVADCKPVDLFLVITRPHAPTSILAIVSG